MQLKQTLSRILQNRALWLLIFAALVLLRLPHVVLQGRFYLDEGQYFFGYAWHRPWYEALLRSFGGYLNIVANASTLLAKLAVTNAGLKLEYAPYVTEIIAFTFQLTPALLLLTARADWLNPPWARPLALVMLATLPAVEEVWLNTLHSQFHLALAAAIVLNTQPGQTKGEIALRLGCLALAPLSGPVGMMLLPAFVLICLTVPSKGRLLETAVLAAAALVQLGYMLSSPDMGIARHPHYTLISFANVLLWRNLFLPLLGVSLSNPLAEVFVFYIQSPIWSFSKAVVLAIDALGSIVIITLVALALKHWRTASARFLLLSWAISVVTFYGAIGGNGCMAVAAHNNRYAFVPLALLTLSLISAQIKPSTLSRIILLLLMLGNSISYCLHPSLFDTGTDWPAEIAKWRASPTYQPIVWGAPVSKLNMRIDLTNTTESCHASSPPSYCNEHWRHKFKNVKFICLPTHLPF